MPQIWVAEALCMCTSAAAGCQADPLQRANRQSFMSAPLFSSPFARVTATLKRLGLRL